MPLYLRPLEVGHRLSKYPAMASLSHRQGWSLVLLLAIFPCFLFAGAEGDRPSATYRTSPSEVRITFFAFDENNRRVEQIEKNDFAVVDGERIIRDFRSLARSDETALDIVLLVDASESVASRFRAVQGQVLQLVSQSPSGDRLSVITFAGMKPSVLCSADCGGAPTEQKLRALHPGGSTPLFDALVFSGRFISSRRAPDRRQVLILFSDGNDTISAASAREALNAVTATGAALYAIDSGSAQAASRSRLGLQELAEATGGRSLSRQECAENVLQAILADLHASYVVTYSLPSREAGFHSLRILPKHNLNLRFHCRRGYTYEEGL